MVRRPPTHEATLEKLAVPSSEPGFAREVAQALTHRHFLVVERASVLAQSLCLADLVPALIEAYSRFVPHGSKADPGCRAKVAILSALDHLGTLDAEPFIAAVRLVQREPVWGGSVDTAGPVRLRGVSGLLRMNHPDALIYAGLLLSDADLGVRAGVAEALGHYGTREHAGFVVQRLALPEQEPEVRVACASSLLHLCFDWGRVYLVAELTQPDQLRRETALLALAQSDRSEAVTHVIDWVSEVATEPELRVGIMALGAGRSATARQFLLASIEGDSALRARLALEALATHRYDPALVTQVRSAVERSVLPRLDAVFAEYF